MLEPRRLHCHCERSEAIPSVWHEIATGAARPRNDSLLSREGANLRKAGGVRELPAEDQDARAKALLSLTGEVAAVVHLDDDTRAAVEEGLAQAERGEFVPDEGRSRSG